MRYLCKSVVSKLSGNSAKNSEILKCQESLRLRNAHARDRLQPPVSRTADDRISKAYLRTPYLHKAARAPCPFARAISPVPLRCRATPYTNRQHNVAPRSDAAPTDSESVVQTSEPGQACSLVGKPTD